MSTVVRIPENTYSRLQKLAQPFIDTPATVIDLLLDFYDEHTGPKPPPPKNGPRIYPPDRPPDLSHTKLLSGKVQRTSVDNWNRLLWEVHRKVIESGITRQELVDNTPSGVMDGRKVDHGFRYFQDINLSIRNVDANMAWKHSYYLARKYKLSIRVHFKWRNREGAAFPGQEGLLEYDPNS